MLPELQRTKDTVENDWHKHWLRVCWKYTCFSLCQRLALGALAPPFTTPLLRSNTTDYTSYCHFFFSGRERTIGIDISIWCAYYSNTSSCSQKNQNSKAKLFCAISWPCQIALNFLPALIIIICARLGIFRLFCCTFSWNWVSTPTSLCADIVGASQRWSLCVLFQKHWRYQAMAGLNKPSISIAGNMKKKISLVWHC